MAAFRTFLVLGLGLAWCGCSSSSTKPQTWSVVATGQDTALLSTWASSTSDAWVVGGAPTGGSPIAEHYDGTAWTKLDTSSLANIDLWWVKGFDDGTVFVSGSQGTIAQTTDSTTFTTMTTPPGNVFVFGMWGAASNDVWAVGGNGQTAGFVWNYDGTSWTARTDVPADLVNNGTCFKVNGTASNDVWISGTNGWVLHWDGMTLNSMQIPAAAQITASLFSIAVNSERVITVGGGFGPGLLYENSGSGSDWTAPLANIPNSLTGVASSSTDAYAVGDGGTVLHSASAGAGGWSYDPSLTPQDLHSVFIDPDGGVWAAGGLFNATPTTSGVLLHKGTEALAGTFQ